MDLDARFRGLDIAELPGGLHVIDARTRAARRLGLARLNGLPAGYALRIPTLSVHTFGMRFALDLVWLRKDGTVARVDHDIAPRRLKLCARARAVIETTAGEGDRFAAALTPVHERQLRRVTLRERVLRNARPYDASTGGGGRELVADGRSHQGRRPHQRHEHERRGARVALQSRPF